MTPAGGGPFRSITTTDQRAPLMKPRPGTPEELGVGELDGTYWPASYEDVYDPPEMEASP